MLASMLDDGHGVLCTWNHSKRIHMLYAAATVSDAILSRLETSPLTPVGCPWPLKCCCLVQLLLIVAELHCG